MSIASKAQLNPIKKRRTKAAFFIKASSVSRDESHHVLVLAGFGSLS